MRKLIRDPDLSCYYYIYDDGRVLSDRSGRFLTLRDNGNGYKFVGLAIGNKKAKQVYVHRLVAEYFCEKPEGTYEINHLDGNKANNHFSNLEWTTREKNMEHARKNGYFDFQLNKYKERRKEWIGKRRCNRTILKVLDEKTSNGDYYIWVRCNCGHEFRQTRNDWVKCKSTRCIKCKKSRKHI